MHETVPIRTLVVDDEAPARSRLRHLLKGVRDFEVVGEAPNGRRAVEAIRGQSPELVFLDVQMPGLNGLEVCVEVGAAMPAVVFVTAYDRFAVQAFEVHAVDYLLKPIDRERFAKTLSLVRSRLRGIGESGSANPQLQALVAELQRGRQAIERLAIKVDGRILFVRLADVDWLEAEGNYVKLHVGSEAHLFRETLSALEADLPADRFLRIGRSAMVNLDAVKELQPLFYGDYAVLLKNGQRLTLSRHYRDRLEPLLARHR